MIKYFFLPILIIFISACAPKVHTLSPTIEGKVIDAASGKPLADAKVGNTTTNQKGRFFIKGKKELGIGTTMGGVWKIPLKIIKIVKKGYKPASFACDILNTQDGCFDIVIKLHKEE